MKFPACLLLLVPLNLALLPAEKYESAQASPASFPPATPLKGPNETASNIPAAPAAERAPLAAVPATIAPQPVILPTLRLSQTPQPRDGNPGPSAGHQTKAPISKTTSSAKISWSPILFTAWLLGMCLYLLEIAKAFHRTQTLRRSATPIDDPQIQSALAALAIRLHLRNSPALLAAENFATPLLTGILRPAILFPRTLLQTATPDQLRLILAHELAHLKRRDLAWNAMQTAIHIVFFFHPLLWLTRRPARFSQELACDQLALAATGASPAAYGHTLLDVISQQPQTRRTIAGVGIAASAEHLRRRITAMKSSQPSSARRITLAASLIAVAGVTAILPWRVVAQSAPTAEASPIATGASVTPVTSGAAPAFDPSKIELTDKIITQAIPIRYFRTPPQPFGMDVPSVPQSLVAGVQDCLIKADLLDANIKATIDEKDNILTLTGTSARIHRLAEIIAGWEFESSKPPEPGLPGFPPNGDGPFPAPPKPSAAAPRVLTIQGNLSISEVPIQSPLDGTLAEVVAKEGQSVHKGDPLFKLDSRAARAALDTAQIKLDSAKIAFDEAQKRVDLAGSKTEVAHLSNEMKLAAIQLQVAQDALDDLTIRSPIDGAVETFNVNPGQLISRGTALTRIADTGNVSVMIGIPIDNLRDFHVGQKFTVRASGDLATAEIDYIPPAADMQANEFLIRGKLISGDHLDRFKSGTFVIAYFTPDASSH